MQKSIRIGPFRLAPHKRNGGLTGKWLVDIPATLAGGKRKRKFFDNCKDAQRFARELDRRYRRGELSSGAMRSDAGIRFDTVVQAWLAYQELRVTTGKKRAVSLKSDRYRLRSLMPVFGRDHLSAITEDRIVAYQAMRLKAGRSAATVNSDLRTLMKILRWAHRKGWLGTVPVVERIPEEITDSVLPTREQVCRIIDHLPDRLKPLVRLMVQTGCRSGEVFHLTWDRIDLERGWVEFRPSGDWTPKTRSSVRRVPISEEIVVELASLPRNGLYVFPGKISGRPLTSIKCAFATAVRRANLVRNGKPLRVTPHTLRKAMATWLAVDEGVPQRVLQSLLGHAPGSTVTDRYYVSSSDEAKRRAIRGLSV